MNPELGGGERSKARVRKAVTVIPAPRNYKNSTIGALLFFPPSPALYRASH